MLDLQLPQRPPYLGEPVLIHLLAGFWRVKIMAAAIGVEGREQPVRPDRLGEPAKTRRRAFLLDKKDRQDAARRIVHRRDQIERRPFGKPGVGRGS